MGAEDQKIEEGSQRYQAIPRTLSFIYHGDQVLLIKGSPHKKIWSGYYNGVGGHIEKGEAILSSARREIFEETGLLEKDIPDLQIAGIIHIDAGDESRGIILFVFIGHSLRYDVQESKEGELVWWRLDKISESNIVEDVPILLNLIFNNEIPFILKYCYNDLGELQVLKES